MKQALKLKKKGGRFRGLAPYYSLNASYFRNAIPITLQLRYEEWWFGELSDKKRKEYIGRLSGARNAVLREAFMAEENGAKGLNGLVRYYYLLYSFTFLAALVVSQIFWENAATAAVGVFCAAFILYRCRDIKTKSYLGCRLFAPAAVRYIGGLYEKSKGSFVKID